MTNGANAHAGRGLGLADSSFRAGCARLAMPVFSSSTPWTSILVPALALALLAPAPAPARAPSRAALAAAAAEATPTLPWTLVDTKPHDPRTFTEGLAFGPDGLLYESAGLYQASGVLKVDPASGRPVATRALDPRLFAEGLAILNNAVYQLTWREHTLLKWSPALEPVQSMPFAWEGWGLTAHGGQLVASDGTQTLRFFAVAGQGPVGVRAVTVSDGGLPLDQLNELEAVPASAAGAGPLAGKILANVWHSPRVAVIDPGNGRVTAWLDLTDLVKTLPAATLANPEAVANGLAWEPKTGLLHVTGKLWPKRFVLRVGDTAPAASAPRKRSRR